MAHLSVWSENSCWDFGSRRTVFGIGVCSPCCRRGITLKTFLTEGVYFSELKNIQQNILTPSELGDRAPGVNFSKLGWIRIAFGARNNRKTWISIANHKIIILLINFKVMVVWCRSGGIVDVLNVFCVY